MKKFVYFLFALLISVPSAFAQKMLKEGYVKMELTKASSDNEEMAMAIGMMEGSVTELYFKQDMYATKMNMMGGMIEMKTLVNSASNTMDMLFNAGGQKMWINSTLDEASKSNADVTKDAKITYDYNDKKVIAGYNCFKMMIDVPGENEMKITGYVTKEIATDANLIQGMQSLKFEGYPMEYTVVNPMMSLTMSAKEVKETVDASQFQLKTDGYKKMTMDEFQKAMGGFGF